MPLIRGCSALVIRCFKRVEQFADWLTGAAGPVFVFLCWTLILSGGIAFFDVVARDISLSWTILLSPIFVLVPLNLYGQYFLVTHVPPGFPSPRAIQKSPVKPLSTEREARWILSNPNSLWSPDRYGLGIGRQAKSAGFDEIRATGKRVRKCRKCDGPKPERTHHCSVCKRCVLMMDHHCPWINSCVGLHNQRHFVLFMAWLSIACWTVIALGYAKFWEAISYGDNWAPYTPRIGYVLLYILSLAIGVAVPVLMTWHLYMVAHGETSIESHDNAYLDKRARSEGLIYLNPYDLGRRKNLQLFFNLGPTGYASITLLLPLLIPPASTGWTFPRQSLPSEPHHKPAVSIHEPNLSDGLVLSPAENGNAGPTRRYVMGDEEGLTDDEEGGGGWMD